jgi:hypothetical protein
MNFVITGTENIPTYLAILEFTKKVIEENIKCKSQD